jgi:N-acetylglucosaminyldiphosphoundecaprenol N-acetyl-beta-D-mannosaminyltransferase
MNVLTMFNLDFEIVTLPQAVEQILTCVGRGERELIVTPNVDHIVSVEVDAEMREVFEAARYRYADGMPLVWLSRIGVPPGLPERVTGADLLFALSEGAARRGASIYLLGAMPGVAEKAAARLTALYPGLVIAGVHSPPFGFEKDEALSRSIVDTVNAARPSILFIGVGTPKQEKWAYRWREHLQCDAILGVGAAIDFAAGTARRAPRIVQRSGFEWLWRAFGDPRRLGPRYLKDRRFFGLALRQLRKMRCRGAR